MPTVMFPRPSKIVLLLIGVSVAAAAEKLPTKAQERIDRVQTTLEAFRDSDTAQIVISNAADAEVTVNHCQDETQPWVSVALAPGQTITLSYARFISLVTQKPDGTFQDQSYRVDGGNKYVIYWNQEFWDMIHVDN